MARILAIDDDPDMRTLLEQTLTSAGYQVVLAADGREGIERQRKAPADLVITDIYMPNLDGLETISQLRHHFGKVAIIAMSGRETSATMLSIAEKLGAVATLQKPFTAEELLVAVSKALERNDTKSGS
jgi:DNA-binding response OmpR family regulator